jgi:septal ring factor EnvC (AmiA/AmiB activator)
VSQYDDEDHSYDGSEETDPVVRELRAEIIRLEAQLDQLLAGVRERERESAEIRAKLAELEEGLERLKARRRRDEKILFVLWVLMMFSLGMSLYTYFKA